MIRTYYVLLCYYPDYFSEALELVERFKKSFRDIQLYIVDNSVGCVIKKGYPSLPILVGDNSAGEFSGWQIALNEIHGRFGINDRDKFIFANDTATRHRYFKNVDFFLFLWAFKKSFRCGGIAGEVNCSKEPLALHGQQAQCWVSTYLFSLTGRYFNQNQQQLMPSNIPYPVAKDVADTGLVFDSSIDSSFSKHVNEWLFPEAGHKGWYLSKGATPAQLIHKANMIYLEKSLSLFICRIGGSIIPVYSFKLARRYRRKMDRAYDRAKRRLETEPSEK